MEDYTDIHSVLLDMMKSIAKACDQLKIPYFLAEGSCLGAVRHHGFIPWDDDLDIAIPIEYIEKFRNLVPSLLGNTYGVYGGGYIDDNPRVINESITIKRPPIDVDKEDKLIHPWVDVFVIYGLPSNRLLRTIHYRKLWFWHILFKLADQNHILNRKRNPVSNYIIKLAGILHTEHIFDKEKTLKMLEKNGNKYLFKNSQYVVAFPTFYGTKEIVPQRAYGEGIRTQFEDTFFSIPSMADVYLKNLYGDYMKLPPEDERQGKHKIEVVKHV